MFGPKNHSNGEKISHRYEYPELVCASLEPNVFCYGALADTVTGTVYTDLPGRFPVLSIRNMQYIFVCYAYESNAILIRPMDSVNWRVQLYCPSSCWV